MEYQNIYYKELIERVVQSISLHLKSGKVCIHCGRGGSYIAMEIVE